MSTGLGREESSSTTFPANWRLAGRGPSSSWLAARRWLSLMTLRDRPGTWTRCSSLFAARAEIDADDIILLYRQLGLTTVDEGLDLVEQAYPGRPIPAKVRFLLTEIVDSLQQ